MYKYLLQPFIWECLLLTFIIYLLLYVVIKRIIEIIIDNSKLKKSMEHFFTSLDGEVHIPFKLTTKFRRKLTTHFAGEKCWSKSVVGS